MLLVEPDEFALRQLQRHAVSRRLHALNSTGTPVRVACSRCRPFARRGSARCHCPVGRHSPIRASPDPRWPPAGAPPKSAGHPESLQLHLAPTSWRIITRPGRAITGGPSGRSRGARAGDHRSPERRDANHRGGRVPTLGACTRPPPPPMIPVTEGPDHTLRQSANRQQHPEARPRPGLEPLIGRYGASRC